jgi:FlaA1/EpsC-like NDP-sugar epimerase
MRRFIYSDNFKLLADACLITLAAFWTWFVAFSQVPDLGSPLPFVGVVFVSRMAIYMAMRLQRFSWINVSRYEVFWLAVSALLGLPLVLILYQVLPEPFTLRALERPYLVVLTEPALYLLLLCGARIAARALAVEGRRSGWSHKILIVGARDAGRALAFQLQESSTRFEVTGFVDDDAALQNRRIRGLPVLGTTADIPKIVVEKSVREIVIANPSLAHEELREILEICSHTHLPVRILPPLKEMIGGQVSAQALREVRMEDLLPRPEVNLDRASLAAYLAERRVLVTGGGGSIGGELCRQVLDAGASELVVLGRGENSVFEMMAELGELNAQREKPCVLIPAICDVRERSALNEIFERYRPQVVFHAAAHKHVPLMEQHPCEAVKNNVGGTLNVVQLSCLHRVERFVMVSTDKAVDPSSVMGATKRIGEMIVRGHAVAYDMNMVSVRFGNVLGSRGSVVPTMTRQIRRRLPVTVTDPEMVRYFMTIPEAVQLVLKAGAKGGDGGVYMLEMGRPVRILDLAYDLIRLSGLVPEQDIPIRIIGRRPGEKLEEALLTASENQGAARQGEFHIAPATDVQLDVLLDQLEHLQNAARDLDVVAVRRHLCEVVPNFKSEFNGAPAASQVLPLHLTGLNGAANGAKVNGNGAKANGNGAHTDGNGNDSSHAPELQHAAETREAA